MGERTGLEMTRRLALGAASAAALARSRTMLALVLKRSGCVSRRLVCTIISLTISGHARLAGNTGWDENDLSTLQTLAQTGWGWVVALDGRLGVDVADIGGDTW
jgi:hypothetical protein